MVSMDPFLVKLGMVYYKQSVLSGKSVRCFRAHRSYISCIILSWFSEGYRISLQIQITGLHSPVSTGLFRSLTATGGIQSPVIDGNAWGEGMLLLVYMEVSSCNLPFSDTYPYIWKLGTTYLRYGCVWQILKMWKWQIFRHTHISSYLYVFFDKISKIRPWVFRTIGPCWRMRSFAHSHWAGMEIVGGTTEIWGPASMGIPQ